MTTASRLRGRGFRSCRRQPRPVNPMSVQACLRERAEELAAPFPELLADAEHLARTVLLGSHGRRRSGVGDEFWQYRPARAGDEVRLIDWRRSARSDVHFVREKEWQAAQSVLVWVDGSQSMEFSSDHRASTKAERSRLLALATCMLLIRAGERVALAAHGTPPGSSQLQVASIARHLATEREAADYGVPAVSLLPPHARALFISDFLGDFDLVEEQIARAVDRNVKGVLLQVLDPAEEVFPYQGRTVFESMGGTLTHETLKAGELRDRYLERLSVRKSQLEDCARAAGWQYSSHRTSSTAQSALLWIHQALERRR